MFCDVDIVQQPLGSQRQQHTLLKQISIIYILCNINTATCSCLQLEVTMKLSVRVRGEWFAIPCKGTETTSWLANEALRRFERTKEGSQVDGKEAEKVSQVRKTRGGALLDPDDLIRLVLDDNDFVSIGKWCDSYYSGDDVSQRSVSEELEDRTVSMKG